MSQLSLFTPAMYSVSELTRHLRDLIENDPVLQDVWVQGEISNFSRPSSGHIYFTLKDSSSSLRCVMWRNAANRLSFTMRDGAAVEVHGSLNVYEAGGQYQLYADIIRPAGEGALYQEFLRLKARLEAEGLFAPERKRALPRWPHRIGIVTSPTGAALRDMIHTLTRRYTLAEIVLSPTPVQGDEAPLGIVQAIERLNRLVAPEVIIVARGGGSIEDLWAFNDERVARAIAASTAPVISGVGHETDFTIADFVSDLRAPTPTAAAELATPNRIDLLSGLEDLYLRLTRSIQGVIDATRWDLSSLENRLRLRSPQGRVRSDRQRLDELTRRAGTGLGHRMQLQRAHLLGLEQRLNALNPMAVLRRGYAVVTRSNGDLVSRVAQVTPGEDLDIQVTDGHLSVKTLSNAPSSEERL